MLETLQKVPPPDNGIMENTWSQSAGNVISWLAGFIDGEGCIGFNKTSKKHYHSPHVCIVNTHKPTIERIATILSALGVRYWVVSPTCRNKPKYKQDYQIAIRGLRRVKPLLDMITPYLFTKKAQAEAVLEFINYRLSLSPKAPYGEKELRLIALLHELNHRGPSETTRAPQQNVEMI
jgi:hypothetical protein